MRPVRPVGVALAVGLAVAPCAVGAQSIAPGDVARGVTVLTRPRPDYDPPGVRLDGFRLDGSAAAGVGWDSNPAAASRNTRADGFTTQSLDTSLGSTWSTHALGIAAGMAARQYFSGNRFDWTDWYVDGGGRYDISPYSNVAARYRHVREHLDVYNFDVQSAGLLAPVAYESDEVTLRGGTRFNRLDVSTTALYRNIRYQDQTTDGLVNRLSLNDFDTLIGSLDGTYAFAPGRYITSTVRLQDISYTNNVSSGRDSVTWQALVGFRYDFDGVWQGQVAVGWQRRDYRAATLRPLEGPAVDASLTWAPSLLTTVTFNVARTLEESIRQDAVSFQRTRAGVRVDHELRRNVIVGGELRVERREYQRPDQTATDGVLALNARYLLNRNAAVLFGYSYFRRLEATGGFPDIDRNLLQVSLRIAL